MTVRFTETAITEFDAILAYVAANNPIAARRVAERCEQILARLADFPLLGHPTDVAGVRIVPFGRYPYLIFYTHVADEILILHVRHGARQRP